MNFSASSSLDLRFLPITKIVLPFSSSLVSNFCNFRDTTSHENRTPNCHPNADSYRDLSPKEIYRQHENEKKKNKKIKKKKSANMQAECWRWSKAPSRHLFLLPKGGMAEECKRDHNRLAELLSIKKG